MKKDVKDYIEKQDFPKKEVLKRVRNIILNTLPNCDEKMAWGVPVFAGGKFYIAAMKERVHIGFAISGLTAEEIKEFEPDIRIDFANQLKKLKKEKLSISGQLRIKREAL